MANLREVLRARLRRNRFASLVYHGTRGWLLPFARPVRTPYGFSFAGNEAMQSGDFEREEVDLVRELLREHDVLVDVGANVGLYTCLARGAGRGVVAVEPLPSNLRMLRANLSMNGWGDTEIAEVGLSDAGGTAEIFGSDTGASLVPGWAGLSRGTLLKRHIRLATLDDVLGTRFSGQRLLVKIDIEGGELACLRGAVRTLERSPAPSWIVEICLTENFPGGANRHYVETFDVFFSRGYRAWTANAARRPIARGDVVRWAAAGHVESGTYNYLFFR